MRITYEVWAKVGKEFRLYSIHKSKNVAIKAMDRKLREGFDNLFLDKITRKTEKRIKPKRK